MPSCMRTLRAQRLRFGGAMPAPPDRKYDQPRWKRIRAIRQTLFRAAIEWEFRRQNEDVRVPQGSFVDDQTVLSTDDGNRFTTVWRQYPEQHEGFLPPKMVVVVTLDVSCAVGRIR
jgi:hypothetical protein